MSALRFFNLFLGRRPIFPYNKFTDTSWKKTILNDKKFEELIFWSSPSLHQELLKLKKGDIAASKEEKVINRLYRYLVRSYSRSTPFGVNAGFYVGNVDSANSQSRNFLSSGKENEKARRLVSPDAEFVAILIRAVVKKTSISSVLKYFMNPTLYKVGDSIRFYEYNKEQSYRISSIEAFPIIDEIAANLIGGGEKNLIVDRLGGGFLQSEKTEFVEGLIKENILVNELEYSQLDRDLLDRILGYLNMIEDQNARLFSKSLKEYQLVQNYLDHSEIGDYPYEEINSLKADFEKLFEIKNIPNLFHIDLLLPPEPAEFSQNELNTILEASDCISRISSVGSLNIKELEAFKRTFFERYHNEVVPLMEVLDPDCGLGFPASPNFGVQNESELLDGLQASSGSESPPTPARLPDKLRDQLSKASTIESKGEINLKDIDLSGFNSKLNDLADTFSIMCSKLPDGTILLSSIGGSSSLNLLGRFSLASPQVESMCKDLLEKEQEQYPEVIIAEIIFIPEGKAGNVAKRKVLTDYFIPVNTGVDFPNKHRLDLNDLYVTIHQGQVVLISKKLNKRVIPRLSSAHNFHHATSATYKFLCYIQHQNHLGFSLDNFRLNNSDIRTPRLTYKNIILKTASWKLAPHHYSFLLKKPFNPEAIVEFFQKLNLPTSIAIKEGDNELPINTHDCVGLKIIWDYLKKKKEIEIIEWLHFGNTTQQSASYTNQMILSIYRERPAKTPLEIDWFYAEKYQKTFLPNSAVLSLKIYCGTYASDELIGLLLEEVGEKLINAGGVKYYYFVRYMDPHYHVRVRLFLKQDSIQNSSHVLTLFMQCCEKLKERKLLWKVEISTYERELKRYSPVNISLIEYIFYQDSKCYMKLDSDDNFLEDEKYRLAHGILNVCYWLKLVKFNTDEKLNFLQKSIEAYAIEFKDNIKLKQINDFFRDNKKVFNTFVNEIEEKPFQFRNEKIIEEMKNNSQEPTDLIPVLPDIIHMSQNRLFSSNQRFNEFLVYCLVEKLVLNSKFLKV